METATPTTTPTTTTTTTTTMDLSCYSECNHSRGVYAYFGGVVCKKRLVCPYVSVRASRLLMVVCTT